MTSLQSWERLLHHAKLWGSANSLSSIIVTSLQSWMRLQNRVKLWGSTNWPGFTVSLYDTGGEIYQILWTDVPKVQCRCWEQVRPLGFILVFWCAVVLGVCSVGWFSEDRSCPFSMSPSAAIYHSVECQNLNKSYYWIVSEYRIHLLCRVFF